jgi:hypothetical protein
MKKLLASLCIIFAVSSAQAMDNDNSLRKLIMAHVDSQGVNKPISALGNEFPLDVALLRKDCHDLVLELLRMEPPITEYTWGRALAAKQVGIQECTKKGVCLKNPFLAVLCHFSVHRSQYEMKATIDASRVLCDAAEYGDCHSVADCLRFKANINIIGHRGLTPLHHCVSLELEPSKEDLENKETLIDFLCSHGADASKKDEYGRTPVDFARTILNSLPSKSQSDSAIFLNNAIKKLDDKVKQQKAKI